MKKKWITNLIPFILLFTLSLFVFSETYAQGNKELKVQIQPQSATLLIGDEVQFEAKLVDNSGSEIDTAFTWSVDATGFGTISDQGLFTALDRGRGFVYAVAGDLLGKAHVTVIDTAECDSIQMKWSYLEILPQDTLILIGESVQFNAYLMDSSGVMNDTTAVWDIRGNQVGTITDNGFFTATDKGTGLIHATLDRYTAISKIFVSTAEDTASADSVQIRFRDRDGIQLGLLRRCAEKEIFKINSLPFPFNLLNGGEIVFTAGSLNEDVTIEIGLPDVAQIEGDSAITFIEQILNGISFNVYVNGILVSPYYFDEPVELILPFKESLLNTLGLTIEDLWIFFYSDSAGYDGNGITNVIVDTSMNKIYAEVIHFSDLVITSRDYDGSTGVGMDFQVPSQFRLFKNYPNPFNPETIIRFEQANKTAQRVTVTVYNLLGQKVRTLLEDNCEPGIHSLKWDGRDEDGKLLGSGIFIYQLKSDQISLSRRMVLTR